MENINKNTKPYRQLYTDEHNEFFRKLLKDPLLFAIYILCAVRARRVKEISPDGLSQFEFWLAETEYAKFGLKPTQHSAIPRGVQKLIELKLVSKTGKRLGNDGAIVYRFLPSQLININPELRNELGNERGTSEERVRTNNNDKNDKKVIDKSITTPVDGRSYPKGERNSGKRAGTPRPEVNFVLEEFSRVFQLAKPADQRPRQWAYHISRKLSPPLITQLFEWAYSQEWGKKVIKLESLYRHIPMFEREKGGVYATDAKFDNPDWI